MLLKFPSQSWLSSVLFLFFFFFFFLNIHIFIMLCLLSSSLHSSLYASFLFPSPRWAAWSGCALASATSSSACSSRSRWTTCAQTSWPSVEPAMKWGRAARLAAYWSWCCCWGIIWTPALETPSRTALIWALSARWTFYSNLGILQNRHQPPLWKKNNSYFASGHGLTSKQCLSECFTHTHMWLQLECFQHEWHDWNTLDPSLP